MSNDANYILDGDFIRPKRRSEYNKPEPSLNEMHDRLVRIETRLCSLMEVMGHPTQTQKPVWNPGVVSIPSLDVKLRDILDAVGIDWNATTSEVHVLHKGKEVISFFLPD